MVDWYEGRIFTNGVHLHYYRTGGAKLPVVLLHGFTDNALCWTHVVKDLEKEYDVIMFDARGHGLSDGPSNGFSTELMADDAAGLIQELQLEKPRLIGHSMGAGVAAQVAATYPDLVQSIVLEDPPWHDWQDRKRDLQARTREERIATLRQEHPRWSDDVLAPMADSKVQFNPAVFQFGLRFSPPWREVVPRISCPMLLLTGDPKLGGIVTAEDVEEMKNFWQRGETVHIGDVGHMIHFEQYDPFMTAVKAFFVRDR